MKRKFIRRPVTASTESESSRVVAIQLDIELPGDVDSSEVVEALKRCAANITDVDFNLINADYVDDLTSVYEEQYPESFMFR